MVRPDHERSRRKGRSRFDARSVRFVREHGKTARTPLAAIFNIPFTEVFGVQTANR